MTKIYRSRLEFLFIILVLYNYKIYYYIKANKEIQKHKWIPETRMREQLPGRSKQYIFGFLQILAKFRLFGRVHFVENLEVLSGAL